MIFSMLMRKKDNDIDLLIAQFCAIAFRKLLYIHMILQNVSLNYSCKALLN